MNDELIVVDKEDRVLGYEDKWKCHEGDGILHRAVSVFIFNDKDELLIQKRSDLKKLWNGFWANSCCTHPRKGEDYVECAEKRLKEELGFSCKLKLLFKFCYQATFKQKF